MGEGVEDICDGLDGEFSTTLLEELYDIFDVGVDFGRVRLNAGEDLLMHGLDFSLREER